MAGKTRKATFSLHTDVLAARLTQWREAAEDPLLLKDVEDVDADFLGADAETARRGGLSLRLVHRT